MSKYSEFFLLGSADYTEISEKLRLRKCRRDLATRGAKQKARSVYAAHYSTSEAHCDR